MSIFTGASNFVIVDGQFIAIQAGRDRERERDALQKLEQHVALGSFHNSRDRRDPPKCLPRTREAVFREISEWINLTSTNKPVLWLYGPAGAGKSAIAQSVAEKVYRGEIEGCLLVATFFFNRSNGERNNSYRLIPSLAYQMISSFPATREFILQAIIDNPHLFSLNLRTQMEKLIIEPLQSAGATRSLDVLGLAPMLIILDGLDECRNSEERTEFIAALTGSIANLTFRLIILCHSRPESDIHAAFNNPQTFELAARIVLDNRFEPDSDIEVLLNHDFSEIKRVHPLKNQLPRNWPPRYALWDLIRKSSGQFIYASTVMKYIASRKHNPMKRLEIVLDVGSGTDASPFKELDALYTLILSSIDKDDRPTLVRIIGMVYFPGRYGYVPITPPVIDDVLGLEAGGTLLILDDLHSLVDVDSYEEEFSEELRPYHASFGDFLKDRSRSDEYHVDLAVVEADCALAYFKTIWYTITNSSTKYQLVEGPDDETQFNGELTAELFEFFEGIPWQHLVRKGMPYQIPYTDDQGWYNLRWGMEIAELFYFCTTASNKSPIWVTVSRSASTEINIWLTKYLKLISSFGDSATIRSIQNELRIRYILQLLHVHHHWSFWDFIVDLLQTPGAPEIEYIDRQKHNLAILDTILEVLLTDDCLFCRHSRDWRNCMLEHHESCFRHLARLLVLSDRTTCVDALLLFFEEDKNSPHDTFISDKKVKQAVTVYRQKPFPDDNHYDFDLEPVFELLKERENRVPEESDSIDSEPMLVRFSDLGICNFNLFENRRP